MAGLDLAIEGGSFVTLVGRSGCGKSTILNMIAGLIEPSSGTIAFADGNPKRPRLDVGYLTQRGSCSRGATCSRTWQRRSVRGIPRAERERRALELIALVGLDGAEHRYPRELSGGMARRASLARMLAADPAILLLDEPFGALDAQLRADLQGELLRLWSGSGKTIVFVTHDIDEALTLADRIVVLQWGEDRIAIDEAVAFPRPRGARRGARGARRSRRSTTGSSMRSARIRAPRCGPHERRSLGPAHAARRAHASSTHDRAESPDLALRRSWDLAAWRIRRRPRPGYRSEPVCDLVARPDLGDRRAPVVPFVDHDRGDRRRLRHRCRRGDRAGLRDRTLSGTRRGARPVPSYRGQSAASRRSRSRPLFLDVVRDRNSG